MAVASVPGRIPAAERRYEASLTGWLNPALPFYAIAGFPLYWMLGLGYFTFVIAAVPMALQLLMIRPLVLSATTRQRLRGQAFARELPRLGQQRFEGCLACYPILPRASFYLCCAIFLRTPVPGSTVAV